MSVSANETVPLAAPTPAKIQGLDFGAALGSISGFGLSTCFYRSSLWVSTPLGRRLERTNISSVLAPQLLAIKVQHVTPDGLLRAGLEQSHVSQSSQSQILGCNVSLCDLR